MNLNWYYHKKEQSQEEGNVSFLKQTKVFFQLGIKAKQ
jgi:hypothetical protein